MTSTTTPSAAPITNTWLRGYRARLTYTRTLHLLVDLVLGTAYFTVLVVMLSTSAALLPTLLGVPLLMLTLLVARGIAHLERVRARVLLGVEVPTPAHPRNGFWRRLLDSADWRSTLYGVLLLPVGVVTGSVTLAGWTTAAAALAYPVYTPALTDPALRLGDHRLTGVPAELVALVIGAGLVLVLPWLMQLLARVDGALVRGLLR